jgi:Carboxypeptidase regulatory-like domain/TonB dependent receptor-like, beta-barrel
METSYASFLLRCIRSKKGFQAFGLMLGVLLLCLPAFPQLNLGSIAGTVTDASGAIIAGAKVTVTDVQRGVSRTLTSDTAGNYSAPSLTPGDYSVTAEYKGFQTLVRNEVAVGVGQAVRVDLSMQPGAEAQTVTVTEAVPLINVSNEVLSSTVQDTQLNQLPINGHLYTKVLDFQPGVHGNPGGNTPNYETNGASGQGNYYLLDGVENVNMFVNSGPLIGAASSTDELTILPQDAVEEVNVMTNPPAEYGWFQGAVVNVGLKSGTNTPHGDAYIYARNNNLDAYDPYLGGAPKQTDDFKQFGGSFGGPLKKDKLFYFGAFDGMRYTVGSGTIVASLPTVNGGAVDNPLNSIPDLIDNLINVQGLPASQLSLNLADCTVAGAAPSAVATCGTKGIFRYDGTTTTNVGWPGQFSGHSNNVIGRIDYHLNNSNSINGEYFFGQALTLTPTAGLPTFWDNRNISRTQMVRAVWIDTPNSNWVNDVRFGYNRYNLGDGNADCGGSAGQPDYAALGFITGTNPPPPLCGFSIVNFSSSGYPALGASAFLADQLVFQNTYTAYDNVSYTHGTHNMKFGFEYHHTLFHGLGAPGNIDGTLTYFNSPNPNVAGAVCNPEPTPGPTCVTDLQNFFAGNIFNGQLLVNPQQEDTSVGFNRYAFYFEDNFRINSRLTADLGLRYELEPAMLVGNNNAGNFDPNSPTGMIQQAGSPLYKSDHHDFGPRAGIAWDITGKSTTILRAGMGVSYDTPQIDDLVAFGFGAGLNSIPTGFALYDDSGLVSPASTNPQAVRNGQLVVPGSGLNWTVGQPVFPSTLGTDLACGTGNLTLPNGITPSPCTIKARGTVVRLPTGQLSMTTSNARSPMYTWTLGIEHAFRANTSLTVNYVGTHASDLPTEYNINQPAPGTSDPGSIELRQPYYSQFPWFQGIFVYGPGGYSNYNALQVTFVQRNFHGLTMNAAYTFSRDLGTPGSGNNPYILQDNCLSCDYGLHTPTQDLGITLVYDLPGITSPAQLLKGWELSSAINVQSGAPFSAVGFGTDLAGVNDNRGLFGGITEPWSMYGNGKNFKFNGDTAPPCFGFAFPTCSPTLPAACINAANAEPTNPNVPASDPNATGLLALENNGCWMSPNGKTVIIPPAQGTFGNMRPGSLIGPGFHEWDLSVRKNFKVNERVGFEFSFSAFNVLNNRAHALGFLGGAANFPFAFGLASGQPNDSNLLNGTGGAREVLLGLKGTF